MRTKTDISTRPVSFVNLGCLNVRGCGEVDKREEVEYVFVERKLDVLVLSETKLRGRGEWEGNVKGYKSGIIRGKAREGVAILLSDWLWETVQRVEFVNSRIMWAKCNVRGKKLVVVGVYAPGMERTEDEREKFWEELNECVSQFGRNENVVIMGDMNAKVGDQEREGVVGKFGVPGRNTNGDMLVGMCVERELLIGNTWFEKKLIHKYTYERAGSGERSLIDYVVWKKEMSWKINDVNVLRGVVGRELTDHFLVEARISVNERKTVRTRANEKKKIIKSSILTKPEKAVEYQRRLSEEWNAVRYSRVGEVEHEWKCLKEAMLGSALEVCGSKVVGLKKRANEWWDGRVRTAIEEKKQAYRMYRLERTERSKHRYKERKKKVKRLVKECKRQANEKLAASLTRNFHENKKLFWKEVNHMQRPKVEMSLNVRDDEGRVLGGKENMTARWTEYFEKLLNGAEERRASASGIGNRPEGLEQGIEQPITMEEVGKAVRGTKNNKSSGMDGVTNEMMKYGGESVVKWLVRVFNICWDKRVVPEDWQNACVVPLYKGKGKKDECKNYRGISLLSVVGKVYGRILINRVSELTDSKMGEEQGGFRTGRGCVDQVFGLKQICEKYLEKRDKDVYVAFLDLEKAYDKVDRCVLWQVLEQYEVYRRLVDAVKSFYKESKVCVRVGRQEGTWFQVRVGLRQGCVMSPWLFNLFMDSVVKEVKVNTQEKGLALWDIGTKCKWEKEVSMLLFADDTVLVSDSRDKLQCLVEKFSRACTSRGLGVNVDKSKVMKVSRSENGQKLNIKMNGKALEQVQNFKYLGVIISADGTMNAEIESRMTQGRKIMGAMKKVWKTRRMGLQPKVGMFEGIVEPTVLYGSETWTLNLTEKRRLEAVEMAGLRAIAGVNRMDRLSNARVREMCNKKRSTLRKGEDGQLRWFGHLMRMNEGRLVKKVYNSEVEGPRRKGRPRRGWEESVKDTLVGRGLNVAEAKELAQDRVKWKAMWRE